MSETLEPREVDRPFLGRWVMTTLALLGKSPASFGAAIALPAVLDLLCDYMIPARFIAGLPLIGGALLLPVFWIILSLLSRRADRAFGLPQPLQHVVSRRAWNGGLLPGCLLAIVSWLLHWALSARPVLADVLSSYTWKCLLLVGPLGVCYFPLMALVPGLTITEAYQLSRKASRLNAEWLIVMFVAALSLTADGFASAVPVGEIISAAILVFIGVFNYVAYLDIFERRLDYAPQPVFVARPSKALPARRPQPAPAPETPRPPSGTWVDSSAKL